MSTTILENVPVEPAHIDEQTILLEALSAVAGLRSDLDDANVLLRRLTPGQFRPSSLDQMVRRLDERIDRQDPDGAASRRAATMAALSDLSTVFRRLSTEYNCSHNCSSD